LSSKTKETKYIENSKQLNRDKNKEDKQKTESKDRWRKEEEQNRNTFKINKTL
jgi:hypothetical protein